MLNQCQRQFEYYIKNPSVTHIKLVAVFFLTISVWFIKSILTLWILNSALFLLFFLAGVDWKQLRNLILTVILSSFFIFFIHLLDGTFKRGIIVLLQLIFIVLASGFLRHTTRDMDFIYAVEKCLKPLAKLGIKADKISMLLFLTLRSITIITAQFRLIRTAQKARGLQNQFLAMIMPLLIKMFRTADSVTEALIARGVELD